MLKHDQTMRILNTAAAATQRAGEILGQFADSTLNVHAETPHDLKLEVDRQCEHAMVNIIGDAFPDHHICGEENPESHDIGDVHGFIWYLDPLDGTVNFFHGMPYYCTAAACYQRRNTPEAPFKADWLGAPVAAAVYDPRERQMITVAPGRGIACNGVALAQPAPRPTAQSVVATSFGSGPDAVRRLREINEELAPVTRKLRCFGSTILDAVNLARGRVHGLYRVNIGAWDLAPVRIIVEEAGGRFHAWQTSLGKWEMFAAAPPLFETMEHIVCQLQPATLIPSV